MDTNPSNDTVAIFWDYENCEVPTAVNPATMANRIRDVAHGYGSVNVFKAYLETSELNSTRCKTLRRDLVACGVTLVDCPHNGKKDVADKMILVDMLAHAIDFPAPATIILISGDSDFVYAVSTLCLRKYTVILMAPPTAPESMRTQAFKVYEWPRGIMQTDVPATTPTRRTPTTSRSGHSTPVFDRAVTSPSSTGRPVSQPPTPNQPTQPWQVPVGHERASSVQHHRSASQPHNSARRIESRSPSDSPSRLPYSEVVSSSPLLSAFPSLPIPVRKSPVWPASRLFATSPNFEPSPLSGHSPPAPVVIADRPPGQEGMHVEASSVADSADVSVSGTEPLVATATGTVEDEDERLLSVDLPSPPFGNTVGLSVTGAAEDGAPSSEPELITMQVRPDIVVPSYVMIRLQSPPPKFKPIVYALERERLRGNSRVASSQLGTLLSRYESNIYARAGCAQLKDYVDLAQKARIVLTGPLPAGNGNTWVALHPVYHGKSPNPPPQSATPTTYPTTPSTVYQTPYPASRH